MSNTAITKQKFSVAIQTEKYQKLVNNTLQDPKRARNFVASVSSAVAVNPDLQRCDAGSVLSAALLGESLELSPSPQLGQYYMVPFKKTVRNDYGEQVQIEVATFVLGYKGYIQLALRSGYYKRLNVISIKKGELRSYDPLNEEIDVVLIADELERETAETAGYYAMFEYMNGFRKTLYWSREKMERHAITYSKGYKAKKGYTFWEKDFDGMAFKTMIRQLISKWGIMSVDMRMAFEGDDAIINEDQTPDYVGDADSSLLPDDLAAPPEAPEEPGSSDGVQNISMEDL